MMERSVQLKTQIGDMARTLSFRGGMLFACEKPPQLLTFHDVSDPYGRSSNVQMWFEYLETGGMVYINCQYTNQYIGCR